MAVGVAHPTSRMAADFALLYAWIPASAGMTQAGIHRCWALRRSGRMQCAPTSLCHHRAAGCCRGLERPQVSYLSPMIGGPKGVDSSFRMWPEAKRTKRQGHPLGRANVEKGSKAPVAASDERRPFAQYLEPRLVQYVRPAATRTNDLSPFHAAHDPDGRLDGGPGHIS